MASRMASVVASLTPRKLDELRATSASTTGWARARSAGTRPMRVRRSRTSSASSAPSARAAWRTSTPSTSSPGATGASSCGSPAGEREDGRRLGAVAVDQARRRRDRGERIARGGAHQWEVVRAAWSGGAGQAADLDRRVDGILRHPAVGRQLAADDAHQPAAAADDRMAAREVGGLVRRRDRRAAAGRRRCRRRRPGSAGPPARVDSVSSRKSMSACGRLRDVGDRAGSGLVGDADVGHAAALSDREDPAVGARPAPGR